jgi:molecular chaperone HtpG
MSKKEYKFQSEINQLLSLIIHTFYSNKDIFLRELISNANDALDRVRHLALTNPAVLKDDKDLGIHIIPNKEDKTLLIRDNGVGMTKQEVIDNLGTIARSGTKEFLDSLRENGGGHNFLIGQFGVGFYSAFLVAEKVVVRTKNYKGFQFVWESEAAGTFMVVREKKTKVRGTEILLHLRDDSLEYLESGKLKKLIDKHSQFINYPIYLLQDVKVDYNTDDSDLSDDETVDPETRTRVVQKIQRVNKDKPLWTRNPREVTREDHLRLFQSLMDEEEDYITHKQFTIEGNISFRAVLYIPEKAPFDMFETRGKSRNMKLYVKRVYVMDDCEDILPDYLNFVRGVVDSQDLPLNISREFLQQNKIMDAMRKTLIRKSLEMFEDLSRIESKYEQFYKEYSKNLKLGIYEDPQNSERLAGLLRYCTSKSHGKWKTFDDYVKNMNKNQEFIYYLSGENVEAIENSPFLEKCRLKNYEVLYMPEPIDEYVTYQLKKYKGIKLICLSREETCFKENEYDVMRREQRVKEYEFVCQVVHSVLGERVNNVRITDKLIISPCCLTTGRYGWNANMERIMKAQVLNNNEMNEIMVSRKTLEINPNNPIIQQLKLKIEDNDKETVNSIVDLLYETSLLDCGFLITNPKNLTKKIHRMMEIGLCGEDEEDDDYSD